MSKANSEVIFDLGKYKSKGPTLGDIKKISQKDPSELTEKEKKQLAEFNQQVKEAFKLVDFEQIFYFQKTLANSLAGFKTLAQTVYNFQYSSYAIIQQISRFGLHIRSVNESLFVTFSELQGQTKINTTTSVETNVGNVKAKKNQVAVGGNIISYQKRGDFCLVKHSDFELLVNQANTNQSLDERIAEIQKLLKSNTNSKPIQVKAQFSKFTAELQVFGMSVSISSSTFQASLCEVLFNSNQPMGHKWHIDDLLETEEFGVKEVVDDERQHWIDRVYQWARQLNLKIATKTGKEDFILVRNQMVFINPTYLK